MTKIRARDISTNEEILVDDEPINSWYNMWHNSENGLTYHDDELDFIDKRLQSNDDQT